MTRLQKAEGEPRDPLLHYFNRSLFKEVIKMQPKWHVVKQLSALNSLAALAHQSPDPDERKRPALPAL